MIVCWLKAVAFVLAIIGTVFGVATLVLGIGFVVVYIGEKVDAAWPPTSTSKKILTRISTYTLIAILISIFVVSTDGARRKVCQEGFVSAYKHFLKFQR